MNKASDGGARGASQIGSDPAEVGGHVGINPRISGAPAFYSERHDPKKEKPVEFLGFQVNQRPPAVALEGRAAMN